MIDYVGNLFKKKHEIQDVKKKNVFKYILYKTKDVLNNKSLYTLYCSLLFYVWFIVWKYQATSTKPTLIFKLKKKKKGN